jgi:hypothetical protein
MTQFILCAIFCDKRRSVSTANNNDGTILGGLDVSIQKRLGAFGKSLEFKDTSRSTGVYQRGG